MCTRTYRRSVPGLSTHPDAEAEFLAAVAWYSERSPKTARRFLSLVRRTMQSIAASPTHGVPFDHGTRRRVLKQFPFSVIYLEDDNEVTIIAIAHARRRPSYWVDRIEPHGR
ncbi:MAG: type II toxin-antitoxin system RelE/ParE family toxin [Myxococcales bacterium FL481]|nr:MAG: type II toxin-antitoxin system RelE/ParE family toxin [Myxococcales bacterium FL481]